MAEFWENDKTVTEAAFWEKDKIAPDDWWKDDKESTVQDGATVASMADATRATVGVVGRAIAARDFAAAGYDAPEAGRLELDQPDESAMTNQAVAPLGVQRKAITPLSADAFLTPLLKFPRVTAQEVSDALSYLASASPDLTQEESEAVIEHTTKPGNLEKIIAGAQRAGVSIPESFTSPLGIATLGTGMLPATAGRVVAGGFAVDMARHIPAQVKTLRDAIASGDSERITEASGNLLASGAMTVGAGKHALTKPKTPLEQVAPLTAEAVAKVAPEPTPELKPGDVLPDPLPPTTTPLTTAAVESVKAKEPVPETPTPTPAAVAGESGKPAPAVTGVEPPAKASVTPEVTLAKPEGERALTTEPAAKVQAEVTKVAKEEGQRSAKDIKDDLIATIQEKLVKAPSEAVAGDKVTIEIPGDGTFTVPNTLEALSGMLARAKKLKTDTGKPPGVPRASIKSSANAISETTTVPKWTAATRAGVDLGKQTLAGIPDPIATIKAVIELAKEASPYIKRAGEAVARAARSAKEGVGEFVGEQMKAQRMTDYRRSVLNWSSKLQQSFGEADSAQRDIRKTVPDAVRREGITNWIQANGDAAVLRARADATADPKLKAGYEAALSLTPDELAVANDVKTAFAELGGRGQTYDVLNSFKENYVTQTWDLGRGPATGGSRTLKERFRFSKASTFPTYFDGEQAGYVPKTKDIAKILPMYLHEMNSVIAARQLVQEMAGGVASDGKPLLAPRGGGIPVEGDGGKATLIMPKKIAKDTGDYKVIENQPALTGWRWAAKDTDGNPIFLKADLALHPEAYKELKKVLGQSAIKEWYQTRTSATAQIPKLLVKAIDVGQAETKRTMLGFFAPFHQVQEGTHAVGHRINPFFGIPKIDLVNDAAQLDSTRHGLMLLPDRISSEQFMEGFRHSGLVSMIPKIGPAADWYSHYLFQEYIPGLKFKTYQHILERNTKVYGKDLKSGAVKPEDLKVLSAEQANAAYGHLNYADLARNPTIMHAMRLILLAPDFFEARARFAGQAIKGIAGAKVGREQILALATLAIAQTVTAWVAAETTGGSWDAKHPFEMVHGDRRYSMRSVPEDIAGLIADSRKFIYSRLSPIIGKGIVQGLSGVDYKGDKVSAGDTAKELAQAPIPLPLRGFLGTSHRNLTAFEELTGSIGLRISRYLPEPVMHGIQLRDEVDLWINRSKKLDSDEERAAYLQKQLTDLSPEDRKKAVTRIKQRTAPGVRRRVR